MGLVSLVARIKNWLYLKNELIEWTSILHAGPNSGKLKVDSVIGHGLLAHETLKSAVSEEWGYKLRQLFRCDSDAKIFG